MKKILNINNTIIISFALLIINIFAIRIYPTNSFLYGFTQLLYRLFQLIYIFIFYQVVVNNNIKDTWNYINANIIFFIHSISLILLEQYSHLALRNMIMPVLYIVMLVYLFRKLKHN